LSLLIRTFFQPPVTGSGTGGVVQTGQNVLPVTQEVAGFNGYQAALVRRQLT